MMDADDKWLTLARDSFSSSDTYFDANIRSQIERNYDAFRSKHGSGSKYTTEGYKYRSKIYRPKTRSVVRRHEAAAAMAYFATSDVVQIGAVNEAEPMQTEAAKILSYLLQYRLDHSIRWFLTCIGAYQDAMTSGVAVSEQTWEYSEEAVELPEMGPDGAVLLDEDGNVLMRTSTRVVLDRPKIRLVPIENLRLDAACDWTDPIGTTPYLIELIPMYVMDVLEKMEEDDLKTGAKKWRRLSESELRSATKHDYDSLRLKREGNRADPKEASQDVNQFDIVWVHRNIIRDGGEDMHYYTLGTEKLLSDPVPLKEVVLHGRRPYVMGYSQLETHRVYPSGVPELMEGLQQEANDIANQRLDNVKLALNRRYFARRGAGIDYRSLMNNVPGSVTLMNDVQADIRVEAPPDVTSSSYAEQDRLNLDIDEITGSFSTSSVQSNRQMNETVGGMNLLAEDSNNIEAYQLRIFTETWVEPVLEQLVLLEQAYETDAVLMNVAGAAAGSFQRLGVDEVTDEMILGQMHVRVNVGFGATSPQKRIERLSMGIATVGQYMPSTLSQLNDEIIISEVFGALGYRDGKRFFKHLSGDQEDPRVVELQQVVEQLQAALQGKEMEFENRLEQARIRAGGQVQAEVAKGEAAVRAAQLKIEGNMVLQRMRNAVELIKRQLEAEENEIDRERLKMELQAMEHQMAAKEIEIQLGERNRLHEILLNDRYAYLPGREDIYQQ